MKIQRTTFLAGVAALALIAGTGLASAQEQSKDQTGAAKMKGPTTTTQAIKKGEGGTSGPAGGDRKMDQRAQGEHQGTMQNGKSQERMGQTTEPKGATPKAEGKRAQEMNHSRDNRAQGESRKGGAMSQSERTKQGIAAQNERHRGAGAMERREGRNGLQGLQGNASGTTVKLSDEQRTRIRESVIDARGAPRVGSVNFSVQVGTVVPRNSVHVIAVPQTLVQIEPGWRGFLYFVYEDEVVIVNPRDMRIVAVLAV